MSLKVKRLFRASYVTKLVILGLLLSCGMIFGYFVLARQITFQQISGRFPLVNRWAYHAPDAVTGVVISPDGVAVLRTTSQIIGLSAETGTTLWTKTIQGAGRSASLLIFKQAVFVGTPRTLYALDVQTGQTIWQTDIDFPSTADLEPAAVSNCCIAVSDVNGGVYVFDRITGVLRWNKGADKGYNSVIIGEPVIYVMKDGILALDAETGETLWNRDGGAAGKGVYDGNILYYGDYPFTIVALDVRTQIANWKQALAKKADYGVLFKHGNLVFVKGRDSQLVYALNAQNGHEVWHVPTSASAFALMGDWLFLANNVGQRLVVLDPTTGNEIGRVQLGLPVLVPDAETIAVQDKLLIFGSGLYVYAFVVP